MSRFEGLASPAMAVALICAAINAGVFVKLVISGQDMSVMLWTPGAFLGLVCIYSFVFIALSVGGTYLAALLRIPLFIPTSLMTVAWAVIITSPYWQLKNEPIKFDGDGLPVCAQAGGIEFGCRDPTTGIVWGVMLVLVCSLITVAIFTGHAASRRAKHGRSG